MPQTREQLADELDYGLRTKRPGTAEYAAASRKQLWPDLPSFLESTGIPLVSDAASLAKLVEAERTGNSSKLDWALALAALLPFVPGTVGALGKKIPKVAQQNDDKFKAAHDAAMLPTDQGGLALPQGNTAMDRARVMGYNRDVYHYTRSPDEFDRFKPHKSNSDDLFDLVGTHVGTKKAAADRFKDMSGTSGYTMPLMIRENIKNAPVEEFADKKQLAINGAPTEADVGTYLYEQFDGSMQPEEFWDGLSSLPYVNETEDPGSISYIVPPNKVRSKFAAFNPLLKNSSNLLASGMTAAMLLNYLNRDSNAD